MITATVIDQRTRETLPGVAFTQFGSDGRPTGGGDVTNASGRVSLPDEYGYRVELLGYHDRDITTAPGVDILVELAEATEELDEFTVYGDRPKRSHWPLWMAAAAIILKT